MTGPSQFNVRRQLPPSSSKPAPKRVQSDTEPEMRDPYKIVNHGKEAMDAAIALQEAIANPRPNSLNKFGWVYKTAAGEIKTVNRGNQACYADLSDNWKPKGAKALYFVDWANHWYKPGTEGHALPEKDALEFAKWAANASVWRNAFVVKDAKKLLSAPAIYNTAHPIRFVVQAAIMMRYIYEKQPIIQMWVKLKKHVHPSAAFYLAQFITTYWKNPNIYVHAGGSGHGMFDSGDCNEPIVLHSLMKRDFSFMKGMHSTYEKAWGYRTLDKIWGPVGDKPLIFPPYTYNGDTGQWGGRIHGWTDLGALATSIVSASMEKAVKELAKKDAKEAITVDRPEDIDHWAPDGPEALDVDDYDDDGDDYIEEDDI